MRTRAQVLASVIRGEITQVDAARELDVTQPAISQALARRIWRGDIDEAQAIVNRRGTRTASELAQSLRRPDLTRDTIIRAQGFFLQGWAGRDDLALALKLPSLDLAADILSGRICAAEYAEAKRLVDNGLPLPPRTRSTAD